MLPVLRTPAETYKVKVSSPLQEVMRCKRGARSSRPAVAS